MGNNKHFYEFGMEDYPIQDKSSRALTIRIESDDEEFMRDLRLDILFKISRREKDLNWDMVASGCRKEG